jgi:hypothetical protein
MKSISVAVLAAEAELRARRRAQEECDEASGAIWWYERACLEPDFRAFAGYGSNRC